jgi:hypothetical protein
MSMAVASVVWVWRYRDLPLRSGSHRRRARRQREMQGDSRMGSSGCSDLAGRGPGTVRGCLRGVP